MRQLAVSEGRAAVSGFFRLILLPLVMALFFTGCQYEKVEHEIGYKGKARVNPWLAAERFCTRYGHDAKSMVSWKSPDFEDMVWFAPASALTNESFTRPMERWTREGGHLVILVEHASPVANDWKGGDGEVRLEPALFSMLEKVGITLTKEGGVTKPVDRVEFLEESYEVKMDSSATVRVDGGEEGFFATAPVGQGRMTVVTDARIFRNRWIGEKDHAALLLALADGSEFEGGVVFLRGSGLSLWGMLGHYLWPLLIGFSVFLVLWLWKNLSRFGPVETAAVASPLRGYDHHLEALGDFQWRLDKGHALLKPLRDQIIEVGQRASVRSGKRDEDFFQFLADRAAISRERVVRALAEPAPSDAAVLTRTAADLQTLSKVLN